MHESLMNQMKVFLILEIAVFKSTIESDFIQWNVTKISPTSANMIRFTNRRRNEIEILKCGLYKIYFRYYSCAFLTNEYREGYIYLDRKINENDNIGIANGWHAKYSDPKHNLPKIGYSSNITHAVGSILEVVNLKRNDKIGCYCERKSGREEFFCCLIIQRLGNTVRNCNFTEEDECKK